jgi:hypothetical protein
VNATEVRSEYVNFLLLPSLGIRRRYL